MTSSFTLPGALLERARTTPHEPWLFHQAGWEWSWRSWGQVADHAARIARQFEGAWKNAGERVSGPPMGTPDGVTAVLAIQATGRVADPGTGALPLPSCRSRIERQPLELPDVNAAVGDEAFPGTRHADLAERAARLDALLAPALAAAKERPIVTVSPGLAAARHEDVLAWSLASGAAWALEDGPRYFVSAVLWSRPTVVLGTPEELAALSEALREKSARRWSRLRAVAFEAGGDVDETPWRELGIAAVRLKR